MTYEIPKDIDIVLYVFTKREMPENPTSIGCMRFLIQSLRDAVNIAEIHPIPNKEYIKHLVEFLYYVRTSKSQHDSPLKSCFERQIKLLELHKIL